jgi:hypothetical protein
MAQGYIIVNGDQGGAPVSTLTELVEWLPRTMVTKLGEVGQG